MLGMLTAFWPRRWTLTDAEWHRRIDGHIRFYEEVKERQRAQGEAMSAIAAELRKHADAKV